MSTTTASCRGCGSISLSSFCDLGMSPLANSYVAVEAARAPERFFPLHALVCDVCLLVQLEEFASAEQIFSDYAYFSSWSTSWLEHAKHYVSNSVERYGLGPESLVVEVASNDGYLLRWFVELGIPVLGVEPAANVAEAAIALGVRTHVEFFGTDTARRLASGGQQADLLVANNVLAHVPDLRDFVGGVETILAPDGRATFEFPHLLNLVEEVQFDTIYHEHFSYFSLHSLLPVLARHGLAATDATLLPTHGGSLRLEVAHKGRAALTPGLLDILDRERAAGLHERATYDRFARRVEQQKRDILRFLFDLRESRARIAGYGAPAKGNTMLNYCGIRADLLEFTVDRSPAKQGTLLPGTRIPVRAPEALVQEEPDVVVLLPWNLREELTAQLADVRAWGGRLAVLQPFPEVLP